MRIVVVRRIVNIEIQFIIENYACTSMMFNKNLGTTAKERDRSSCDWSYCVRVCVYCVQFSQLLSNVGRSLQAQKEILMKQNVRTRVEKGLFEYKESLFGLSLICFWAILIYFTCFYFFYHKLFTWFCYWNSSFEKQFQQFLWFCFKCVMNNARLWHLFW